MSKINKPQGIPTLFPYLFVKDGEASINFYQQAFGFKVKDKVAGDNGKIQHAEMTRNDALFMFAVEGAYPGQEVKSPISLGIHTMPVNFYIYCEDVDSLYKQAIENGAKSKMEPFDAFWGDRMCSLIDIDGYEWCFARLKSE